MMKVDETFELDICDVCRKKKLVQIIFGVRCCVDCVTQKRAVKGDYRHPIDKIVGNAMARSKEVSNHKRKPKNPVRRVRKNDIPIRRSLERNENLLQVVW